MSEEKKDQQHNEKEKETEIPVENVDAKNSKNEKSAKKKSEADAQDYLNHLKRLQAEFTNYKARVDKERVALYDLAKSDLIAKILPVIDDLDRMIDHHEEDKTCEVNAIQLIVQKFKKTLTDEGLEEIECEGQPFNPEIHEALGVAETDEDKDGIILQEWQKGYKYGDRLVRASRVQVGKYTEKKDN